MKIYKLSSLIGSNVIRKHLFLRHALSTAATNKTLSSLVSYLRRRSKEWSVSMLADRVDLRPLCRLNTISHLTVAKVPWVKSHTRISRFKALPSMATWTKRRPSMTKSQAFSWLGGKLNRNRTTWRVQVLLKVNSREAQPRSTNWIKMSWCFRMSKVHTKSSASQLS